MRLPEIARKAIESVFIGGDYYPDERTKNRYGELGASFVTLTKNGKLRGCIGSLEAHEPLWEDVKHNAISAAFYDARFSPLTKQEFQIIKIEVSVLTKPKKLEFETKEELLEMINNKMGIILRWGDYSSTFLPQVWEEIKDKVEFLEQLSLKADLEKDAWKSADVFYYEVEKYKE